MIIKIIKKIFGYGSVALLLIPFFGVKAALLTGDAADRIIGAGDSLGTAAGFASGQNPGSIVATILTGFLSLLGIIFIVLIIYGGYNWMTAAGEEQKVEKAKDTIKRAVIGLIIIVAAYSITYFVFTALDAAMSGNPSAFGG
ncbi:hypothetical protein A2303_06755 [Candidatus Falkowbacteria bacterium RIFOXYB2_FULL_47_14]|uniref:Uncharacterized protein n=1 Tax=Candidatus Falkowbacteria bacterium RIFOXYA2_FULL_47_19 TaxID=1797994 RepID=A0A1F5SGC9_9BACT|nr:MAG: hypothetical protein A2227_00500 [Candidatus Falkowbacteria bacterium RIFOXYA2_FULL_47_19]OGF35521.1 MAG: hypothetical protein A2468_05770 [Candidatus Falkowbacteria bacterium RIFOXYC2_FULL_46_15]OGF43569.1 MAG: hypothetical protein A2303_06755 [Candidatus Falkowbacteria bacterium RIFOXYB2_FULL_47_14]